MSQAADQHILLNPGPVCLSDAVRRAAVAVDLCHRESEFTELQAEVLDGLLAIYDCDPATWRAVALGGSGTAAVEAMLASLVPAKGRLLVARNGVYGERMARIADVHGIAYATLDADWGQPIDLQALSARLQDGEFTHLALVHHETTTGLLNPLEAIADACQAHGVQILLDGVSSFGAEAIDFSHPALAACAATSNKCLHGIPGLAVVLCRANELTRDLPERSFYLHLPRWADAQASDTTPFTPAINAFLALRQALAELRAQGGWTGRRARYLELAESLRAQLAELGVEPWLATELSSCVLRSYRLPTGLTYNALHGALKARGFIIYAGQGGLAEKLFRISMMGEISDADGQRLGAAFKDILHAHPA